MSLRTLGAVGPTNTITRAAEAVNMTRGYAVKQGVADGGVALISAAGGRAVGVLNESTVNVGDAASVTRQGDSVAIAGAAIAAGQYVKVDATSRCVPVNGAAGGGEEVLGRAESTQTTAGGEFILYVNPFIL